MYNNSYFKKQIDKQEQFSKRNYILMHGMTQSKGEVTDYITVKTICENINDNIVAVDIHDIDISTMIAITDNIDRTHKTEKCNPQKKNPRHVIVKFVRCNVRERVFFSNQRKLKGKQISISKSLTKLRLIKLKEAREQYLFANVWTQDGKIMFKDDNKVKVYFDLSMDSKLRCFTLMEKEIAFSIISLFCLRFLNGFFMDITWNICFSIFLSRAVL